MTVVLSIYFIIMAESKIATAVVPLNGINYPTWKIQCKMALMKEGLWKIITGEQVAPTGSAAEQSKFAARRDKALANIVLSVDTSLLYLIKDPSNRSWCCLGKVS